MLKAIKRLFAGGTLPPGWSQVMDWAAARGHAFKRSRDGSGFVVDVGTPAGGARLEWGPSHRHYIAGHELRLRADLGAAPNLQMLLMSRPLLESIEKLVFDQLTDGVQTRIDTATPEEMRWLVLYTQLPAAELQGLRESFGAVASVPQAVSQWLEGPLSAHLKTARTTWLNPDDPLALVVQRARLTLRSAMHAPDAERIAALVALFEVARQEARRVADQWSWASGAPSTQPSMFSAQPEERDSPKG